MISDRDYIRDIPVLRRLKRCPFCGDNVNMLKTPIFNNYVIQCQNDDCAMEAYFYGAEFKADVMTERWNRRTEK